ncbi:hypothetical protein GCM10020367_72190 [Streptomyces sannanensis]|uniref:Uncharacterized protein n=1 Tax=Streptomyces sannanensis TaxID=285536 RepID=A0ABP6SPM7_9ACTN
MADHRHVDFRHSHPLVDIAAQWKSPGALPDVITTNTIRPKEPEQGLELPLITDTSQYPSTPGRGNKSQLQKRD